MKFIQKKKGAISIFLVIILLPTITVSGLFLDVSRTKLSQEVVSTSADLALNTVLSDYDKNLKDYFGLLASCQNSSEVIELSKQYFIDSMVSTGVTTSDAEAYVDEVLSAFAGDDDIRDMLRLSADGDVKITAAKDGSLNNPALLKSQIIEFMKYRAPINGVADLFKKITDSDVAAQVSNASKETDMVDAKKDFYDAEKKLIKQAEKAYKAIKKYENYQTWTERKFNDEEYLNDLAKFLASPDGSGNSFESIFKSAHEKMVMNLYNTHDTSGTLSINLIQERAISVFKYNSSEKASASKIKELLKKFNTALNDYITARSSLNTAWEKVGELSGTDYPIQYWVVLTSTCSKEYYDYTLKASVLGQATAKLKNAVKNADENSMGELMNKSDVPNKYVTYDIPDLSDKLSLQSIYNTLITKYNSTYKSEIINGDGSSAYRKISSQIVAVNTNENRNKLALTTVNEIYNIRNKVYKYQNDFNEAFNLAKVAKDETNKLKNLLEKYKKAFEKWKTAANDSELQDSDLAKKDRKKIEELETTGIELFTDKSVTDLVDRLNNIQTLCKTFRDDLKNFKYNSMPIINISDYNKFRNAAGLDSSKIVRNKNALIQYTNNTFSFSIGKQIQRVEIHDNTTSTSIDDGDAYVITDSFNLNLQKTKLELYEWMKKKFDAPVNASPQVFDGKTVDDEESAEEVDSKISKKSENTDDVNTSENIIGNNFGDWSGATLPSKGEGSVEKQSVTAKIGEVSKFTSEIFSNFGETFMNSLVNMRDDLYMTDYVFSMFTYDTFAKEGCYSQLDPSVQNGLKASEAEEKYKEVRSKWEGSNDYKTLTLTPRNEKNNWAYGSEVEYILYGKPSNSVNKTTAYAKIYMIRYALDISAVFQNYWDDEPLNLIADALEAFAYIPAELTKTVACLAITAAEAGVDIKYLKEGLPVVLCKQKNDLYCNYKSVFMGESQSTPESSNRVSLQYSDYLKVFLFIKLIGNNENVIYTRTADVIQANIALSTNKNNFALSKAQVYFNFKATVIVEPMWSRFLAIDNLGDLSTSKGWRSMTINITRGY